MKGLFAPGVALNNRLSYSGKFWLVSCVMAIPAASVIAMLIWGGSLTNLVRYVVGGIALAGVVLDIYLLSSLYHAICETIDTFKVSIMRMAKGDLSARIKLSTRDEMVQVANGFNEMAREIRRMIANVSSHAMTVAEAAHQFSDQAGEVARGSQEQSQAAMSTAASVEEMAASIHTVADHTAEAEIVSNETSEISKHGEGVVLQASSEMHRLDTSVKETAVRISGLGQRSNEISGIVKVIRDIADQTNLLALNAAIEAARAGEQGRGFAVVADEVRKLAERTSNATLEIGEMILSIQNETKTAVVSMESGASQVQAGVDLALQAGDSLKRINEGSQKMVGMVHDIAAAIKEQSTASEEIASHVIRISQMSEENSGYVDKMLAEAKQLDQIAESLKKSISQFVGGTANEAKNFVEKAVQYYHAQGRNKAFSTFSDPTGEFVQRDMYIFVYSLDGRVLAHGGNASLIGKDMRDSRDANGKLFIQDRIQLAMTKGLGWQDYQFVNPDSGQVEQKTSFIQKVDDFVIGCGVYK